MQEPASKTTVQEVLSALEELLTKETQVLVQLDAAGVEATSQRKLELTQSLAANDQPFTTEERLQLTRVRVKLRNNLVLLAHAREHVHVKVRAMTGRPPPLTPDQQPSSISTRLDLRG